MFVPLSHLDRDRERRELAFMLIVDDGAAAAAATSNFRANSWSVPSFSKKSTKVVVFYRLTGKITGKTVLPVCW